MFEPIFFSDIPYSFCLLAVCLCFYAFWVVAREKRMRISLLNDVFEASDYGKILFSSKGRLINMNERAKEALSLIVDYDLKAITQTQLLDSLHDHAAEFDDSIRNTVLDDVDDQNIHNFREVVLCGGGEPYLVTGCQVNSDLSLFTFNNIHIERTREASLLELDLINRHLFQAVQAVSSGVIISDPKLSDNPVVFANEAFYGLVGCDESTLLSEHWQTLFCLIQDEHEKQVFLNALSQFSECEISVSRQTHNADNFYSLTLAPVYDSEKNLDLYVGILNDVTLLKQREQEFFHSQKLDSLGRLSAGVAHDFNNLLSIISGYSLMIEKNASENSTILGFNEKIRSAAERGAGLTRKMLTFSKHKVVAQDTVDLRDVLLEQKELLKPLFLGLVDVSIELEEGEYLVRGDVDSLSQVIMNLAINARDAMPDGGEIKLSLDRIGKDKIPKNLQGKLDASDYVRLDVSDTGSGMSAEVLSKIFDPFFSTKESGKGTGLGLSVVYGLINEMGGLIDVHSAVGQGTTFSVYFSQSTDMPSKAIDGDLDDISSLKLSGYRVLLVEDEPDLRNVILDVLGELDVETVVAFNGNEALALCEDQEGGFDIVLTDVVMPEMNGVKFSELALSLYPNLKIVFMSGYPAQGNLAPIEIPDGFPFISKPVDGLALKKIMYQVVHNSDLNQSGYAHWKKDQ